MINNGERYTDQNDTNYIAFVLSPVQTCIKLKCFPNASMSKITKENARAKKNWVGCVFKFKIFHLIYPPSVYPLLGVPY